MAAKATVNLAIVAEVVVVVLLLFVLGVGEELCAHSQLHFE